MTACRADTPELTTRSLTMIVRYRLRLYLLCLVFVAGFSALLMKLWSLQIDEHGIWLGRLPGATNLTVRVPGIRGEIKDRNGITLVSNEPNFEVLFNLDEIVRAYEDENGSAPTKSRFVSATTCILPLGNVPVSSIP